MPHPALQPKFLFHMTRLLSVLLLGLLGLQELRAGTVETKDRKTLQGQITFAAPDAIQVKQADGTSLRVPLKELLRASFAAPNSSGPWTSKDIGEVALPGSTVENDGTFTITASGWGLWSSFDAFRYMAQPLVGDGQIVARLAGFQDDQGEIVAGISFRESLENSARHASLLMMYTNKTRFRIRAGTAQNNESTLDVAPQSWLRLSRQGDQFTAFLSTNGTTWNMISQKTLSMKPEVFVGLAASTRINTYSGAAKFDHVGVASGFGAGAAFRDLPLQGLVLRDGSVLAGKVSSKDPTVIQLAGESGMTNAVPVHLIAAVLFRYLSADTVMKPQAAVRKGLMLHKGEMFEGDLKELTSYSESKLDTIQMSSVLFGLKKFNIAHEALALILGGLDPVPPAWNIRSKDGTRISSDTVTIESDRLIVNHAALGKVIIPAADVVEISSPSAP